MIWCCYDWYFYIIAFIILINNFFLILIVKLLYSSICHLFYSAIIIELKSIVNKSLVKDIISFQPFLIEFKCRINGMQLLYIPCTVSSAFATYTGLITATLIAITAAPTTQAIPFNALFLLCAPFGGDLIPILFHRNGASKWGQVPPSPFACFFLVFGQNHQKGSGTSVPLGTSVPRGHFFYIFQLTASSREFTNLL